MKTFRIHLKGSSQPVTVEADAARYSGGFLLLEAGNTKGDLKLIAQFVKSETQGYSIDKYAKRFEREHAA